MVYGQFIREKLKELMENYYIVELPLNEIDEAKVCHTAREQFSCQGVEEFSLDEPRVDELLGERSYSGADIPVEVIQEVEHMTLNSGAKIKLYFSDQKSAQSFCDYLKSEYELNISSSQHISEDWNTKWRESFQRIDVGEKLAIIPSWEKPAKLNEDHLYIYPGMGFGTGNHETTFLCLKLFDTIRGKARLESCLDYGCGSGILGLAFALYSKGQVDLYDIDEDAIENCRQNMDINKLKSTHINLYLPSDKQYILSQKYQVVFANILQNVLLGEAEDIVGRVDKGGYLILSGLLNGQELAVIKAYQKLDAELILESVESKGDWTAVLMARK